MVRLFFPPSLKLAPIERQEIVSKANVKPGYLNSTLQFISEVFYCFSTAYWSTYLNKGRLEAFNLVKKY